MVLVPFTLPGERVAVEEGRDLHANLREVVSPAANRRDAACPLFQRCGGCHYQHAPYEFQVAQKVEILREQLRRVGKIDYQGEIGAIHGPELGYRNRVQLRVRNSALGYLAPQSHDFVALDGDCPIASPKLNEAIAAMRERMSDSRFPRFVHEIELFTNETDVQINILETERPVAQRFYQWCDSKPAIEYPTSFGNLRVSPKSFFQVNRFLIDKLIDATTEGLEGKSVLDLYAGVGLFSIPLTKTFRNVTAVESGPAAIHDLDFSANRLGAKIEAIQGRVEDYLAAQDRTPSVVVADPPRTGLGKSVTTSLNRLKPERIVIVSCDPATLARDLAALSSYEIESLKMVDLFPQTFHLETVARLRRRTVS